MQRTFIQTPSSTSLKTLLILPLVFVVFSGTSYAADYFWRPSVTFQRNDFNSPFEACEKAREHRAANRAGANRFIISAYEKLSSTQYRCRIEGYIVGGASSGALIHTEEARINRFGNGCDPHKIYHEALDRCTTGGLLGGGYLKQCITASTQQEELINYASGNQFFSYNVYSGHPNAIGFIQNYNSHAGTWRHNYSARVRFAGNTLASILIAGGRELFFNIKESNSSSVSGELDLLTKTATGWQFISTANERFIFDTAGKLTQWSNAHGAVHQLAYAGSQVTVTDNLGNSLSFTEDADHQPLTMSAPGVQITYGYNANKRLTSVTRVAGGQTTQRQFHYEDSRNNSWLTGITDERGVRYATWSYDDKGRAISSEHADGADKVTVAYNGDGTVSVTNELGKVAKYSFQYIKGVKRITSIQGEPSANCPNSNSSFTYDSNGLLMTKTDNMSILTTYTYNPRGLEVSRTEASGTPQARTITTEWHPTLFLPLVVTEPNQITRYQYDDQGRQLSRTVEAR